MKGSTRSPQGVQAGVPDRGVHVLYRLFVHNFIGLKWFGDLFEIKHTESFYFCIFPLPYIVISEIDINFSVT